MKPAGLALLIVVLAVGGCGDDGADEQRSTGPSEEYRVARAIRAFVVGVAEGDGAAACRVLTPQRRAEVTARLARATCEQAIVAQGRATSEQDLRRLGRSRVTKVDLDGREGRAAVATPGRTAVPEEHTVQVSKTAGGWKIASDFFPGGIEGGKAPKAPPPPPHKPAEERKVAAVFDRFRAALRRGDGKAACALRTPSARRAAVRSAIDLAGGRREAMRDFGELSCERVSLRLRPPDDGVRKVVVDGATARLTLRHGATYDFRKIGRSWRLDT